MAGGWLDVTSQQAELLSSRLRDILSAGIGLLKSELGVDLGLKPQVYPSWVILLTSVVGLLLVVVLSLACSGRKQTPRTSEETPKSTKAPVTKVVKTEDQKRKNKKKPIDKKSQPNDPALLGIQEDVKITEEAQKQSPEIKTEKTKKNKKKTKVEVKLAPSVTSPDRKESDEGVWETKVSNREKRQQRRKDKPSSEGSGSPGALDPLPGASGVPLLPATTAAPLGPRKSREPQNTNASKREDGIQPQVSNSCNKAPTVNGGEGVDSAQTGGAKWVHVKPAAYRNAAPAPWGRETEGAWSGINGGMKTDLNPMSVTGHGLNTTEETSVPQPVSVLTCDIQPKVEDQWSGPMMQCILPDGMATADPNSDWNAPLELWGNYQEEPEPESPAPPKEPEPESPAPPKEPEILKVSDSEKEKGDSAIRENGKSKRKKKKKREDLGGILQEPEELVKMMSADASVSRQPPQAKVQAGADVTAETEDCNSQKLPVHVPEKPAGPELTVSPEKQDSTTPSMQKGSSAPPKLAQKKKARRER